MTNYPNLEPTDNAYCKHSMSQMYNSLFQFLECPPKHPLFRLQTNKSYILHFYVTIMQKDARCAFFIGKLNNM